MVYDERMQPFPAKFASPTGDANLFVARSGEISHRDAEHMHRHDFYEFVWMNEGRCDFFSDFKRYELETGTLIFISPGQLHAYITGEDYCRIMIFGFRPVVLTQTIPEFLTILPFDNTNQAPIYPVSPEKFDVFEHLFNVALSRFDARVPGWEPIATSYLQTALTETAYLLPESMKPNYANAAIRLTRAFQSSLEQHYVDRRQVSDYAELLSVTTNHLVKSVRETTGETPKQMLQRRLLLESKRLLIHSNAPINEIGDRLYFKDATSFSRWFRHLTNTTPAQFRKQSPLA
ncbi:MAG: AraC family transcriptional regulator [Chloroflexota bacterium]